MSANEINDKPRADIAKLIFGMSKRKEKKSQKSRALEIDRKKDELLMQHIKNDGAEIEGNSVNLLETPHYMANEKQRRAARKTAQKNQMVIN